MSSAQAAVPPIHGLEPPGCVSTLAACPWKRLRPTSSGCRGSWEMPSGLDTSLGMRCSAQELLRGHGEGRSSSAAVLQWENGDEAVRSRVIPHLARLVRG